MFQTQTKANLYHHFFGTATKNVEAKNRTFLGNLKKTLNIQNTSWGSVFGPEQKHT